MLQYSTAKDRLYTTHLGGCSIGLISSPTYMSRPRHLKNDKGATLRDANNFPTHVPGSSAVKMGTRAATQLVALWRANRVAGVSYKGTGLTAEEVADGGDDDAGAIWHITTQS